MTREIRLALVGNLAKYLEAERKEVAKAIYDGTLEASEVVRRRLRQQVTGAGLGERLARTWQRKAYPGKGIVTLEPAAIIYSKAPQIIRGFSQGDPIRSSREAGFLAIPTEFTPRRGRGSAPISMSRFLEEFGLDSLRVLPKKGSGGRVLYAIAEQGFRRSRGRRGGSRRTKARGRIKDERLLMYVLVKQVRLGQRLNIETVRSAAEALYPRLVARKISERLGNASQ
ncbi:hypothetical protein H2509_20540 [Stappia sp. F7233]|uniref:Uncharacterized protein n=1 Tax=Stappia albiluteola TaxID=2758565 RepID=A0A839AKD5_9HYPH|nr:DUF6441 family protein [Stappia albiluteola]MBA5779526.1 hypothetical protein [Stappia albiluteola]